MPKIRMPDVVVLLPGILGSVLKRNNTEIWGLSAGSAFNALTTLTGSITDLEVRADPQGADVDVDVWEGVSATGVLPDLHMLPGFWKIDGYSKIADYIKKVFDVTPGQNYFEFAYDWRLSNSIAAQRLKRMSKTWLDNWRAQGHPNARLILIGHSMGGLVARYFLEVLNGWEVSRSLITFGTPHRGSLNALDFIANGWRKTVLGINVLDLSALVRSFTSVYELLPTYKCCSQGFETELKYVHELQIPNMDRERALKAKRDFHGVIETKVQNRGTQYDRQVHPVVGAQQPTSQSALLRNGVLQIFQHYGGEDMSGDGTVPRVSATPIELSDTGREMFAAERHSSLQNNDAVLAQMQGIIETGYLNLAAFRGIQPVRLSLDLEDAYTPTEPVIVRAKGDGETGQLKAKLQRIEDRTSQTLDLLPAEDGWQQLKTERPLPGTYRVTVYGDVNVSPVTDVFMVV